MERLLVISSDGHVTARMPDYRPYLPTSMHDEFDEFDEFCKEYERVGSKNFDSAALSVRLDKDVLDQWEAEFIQPGRLEGYWDPDRRAVELAREGITAEVLYPDFGLPFELFSPGLSAYKGLPSLTPHKAQVRNQAFNRWLVDFCSIAPERFFGVAMVDFSDADAAVTEIRWARAAGLRGVLLPHFSDARPIYHPSHEAIWAALEEFDMQACSHAAMSSIKDQVPILPMTDQPACWRAMWVPQLNFFGTQLLTHLIWGGVLERHPRLKVTFTEQGTGWVIGALASMDYTYEGSYAKREVRQALSLRPSEYFSRQCYMGSSLLSRAEVQARYDIGIDKIMFGADYPHHEGALVVGMRRYLQETLGGAGVSLEDARLILGENIARAWGFDLQALRSIADAIGPTANEVLTPPEPDPTIRGDIRKPLTPY